jgi:hypothetical protein
MPRPSAAGAWMLFLLLKCWHFFLRKLKAKLAFVPTAPKALDCVVEFRNCRQSWPNEINGLDTNS